MKESQHHETINNFTKRKHKKKNGGSPNQVSNKKRTKTRFE